MPVHLVKERCAAGMSAVVFSLQPRAPYSLSRPWTTGTHKCSSTASWPRNARGERAFTSHTHALVNKRDKSLVAGKSRRRRGVEAAVGMEHHHDHQFACQSLCRGVPVYERGRRDERMDRSFFGCNTSKRQVWLLASARLISLSCFLSVSLSLCLTGAPP